MFKGTYHVYTRPELIQWNFIFKFEEWLNLQISTASDEDTPGSPLIMILIDFFHLWVTNVTQMDNSTLVTTQVEESPLTDKTVLFAVFICCFQYKLSLTIPFGHTLSETLGKHFGPREATKRSPFAHTYQKETQGGKCHKQKWLNNLFRALQDHIHELYSVNKNLLELFFRHLLCNTHFQPSLLVLLWVKSKRLQTFFGEALSRIVQW